MITDVIRNNLILDLVDSSPSSFVSAYPELYPTNADVPDFLYKSLKTLVVGAAASSQFVQEVSADLGTGGANAKGGINIILDRTIPAYLDMGSPVVKSQQTGAESSFIKIIINKPRTFTDSPDAVQDISLRVRYLLDHYERSDRGLPELTISGDKNISQDYIKMFWLDTQGINPDAGVRASGAAMYFKCVYRRAIPG